MANPVRKLSIVLDVDGTKVPIELNRAQQTILNSAGKIDEGLKRIGGSGLKMGNDIGAGAQHGVTNVQALSGAIRGLDGSMNIRAAERFLGQFQGIANIARAAFPVFGLLAVGEALSLGAEKATKFYEALRDMPLQAARIASAFRGINDPITQANDSLQVANDKLANEIAKLEGKPANGVKLALDEAVESADKLASLLEKDQIALNNLLKEHKTPLWAQLLGMQGGSDLSKNVGGVDGQGGFTGTINGINDAGADAIRSARDRGDSAGADSARKDLQAKRTAAYQQEIKWLEDHLAQSEALQAKRKAYSAGQTSDGLNVERQGYVDTSKGLLAAAVHERNVNNPDAHIQDQTDEIARTRGTLRNTKASFDQIGLTDTNADSTKKLGVLKDAAQNAKDARIISDALAELKAQLAAVRAESYVTQDGLAGALAKGAAEATQKIDELNKRLAENHRALLSQAQAAQIYDDEAKISAGKYENTNLTETSKKQTESLKSAMDELIAKQADLAAKHKVTLDTLQREVVAAEALATAASQGPEAERKAKENLELSKIDPNEPEIRGLTQKKLDSENKANVNQSVAAIKLQTAATNELAAAWAKGRDAQRAAELDTIKNSGQSQAIIQAQVDAKNAQFNMDDVVAGRNQSAADGAREWWQQFKDNAKSAGQVTKETMSEALGGVNDQLSKLITGQKTSWLSMFQGLGANLAKSGLGTLEVGAGKALGIGTGGDKPWSEKIPGLGSLGGMLGLGGGKRDGSSAASALFVTGGAGPSSGGLGGIVSGAAGTASKGIGGFFKNLFKGGGGASDAADSFEDDGQFALGGDVDPSGTYMVGENGPEPFTPKVPGTISPANSGSSGSGGGSTTITNNIDARGTEAAQVRQAVNQSAIATHGAAVRSSVQAQQEISRRRPRGN